jgi:hypothetical protein
VNRRRSVDYFAALLAKHGVDGPQALAIIDAVKTGRRRGRPPASEKSFRKLFLLWESFRSRNRGLDVEQSVIRFLWVRRREIGLLNLKRGTTGSLRNALTRGRQENARVKKRRRDIWQLLPVGLAKGSRLIADPDRAAELAYLRWAARRALLGEGTGSPLVEI